MNRTSTPSRLCIQDDVRRSAAGLGILIAVLLSAAGRVHASTAGPCDEYPCSAYCDPDCNPACGNDHAGNPRGPCNEHCLESECGTCPGGDPDDCRNSCCPCSPGCGDRSADVSVSPDLTWIGDVVTATVCSDGDIVPACYELLIGGAEFTTQDFPCPLTYPSPAQRPYIEYLYTPEPSGWCVLTPIAEDLGNVVYLPHSYTFHLFTYEIYGAVNIGVLNGPVYGGRVFTALSLDLALGDTGFPEATPLEDEEPGYYLGVNDDFNEGKPTEDREDVSPISVPHLPNEVAIANVDDMLRLHLDLIGKDLDSTTCGGGERVSVRLSVDSADRVRLLAINPACLTQANCGSDPLCPNCFEEITSGRDVAPDYIFGAKSTWQFYLEGLNPGKVRVTAEGKIDEDSSRRRIDKILFNVAKIDADVDSDNTNTTAPYGPDAPPATPPAANVEDRIEEKVGEPGRYIPLNTDDDDLDGLQDYDPDDVPVAGDDNDLVAITFAAPNFTPVDPNYVMWSVSISSEAIDISQYADKSGYYLPPGGTAASLWTTLPLPQTWYIQGLQVTPAGPVQITLQLLIDPDGAGTTLGYQMVHEDRVQVTVLGVDIDVDSDNDDSICPPRRSLQEENAELTGWGKLVLLNNRNGDSGQWYLANTNHDLIDDWGDGFNLDGASSTDIELQDDNASFGEGTAYLVVEIPAPVSLDQATCAFVYWASDPGAATFSRAAPHNRPNRRLDQPAGGGYLRIWKPGASHPWSSASVNANPAGNYVPAVMSQDDWAGPKVMPVSALGLSGSTRFVTLVVEGVVAGGNQIVFYVDPDGPAGPLPMGFLHDNLLVTPVGVEFSAVTGGFDGSINPPGAAVPLPGGGTNSVNVSVTPETLPVRLTTRVSGAKVYVPGGPYQGTFVLPITSLPVYSGVDYVWVEADNTPDHRMLEALNVGVFDRKEVTVQFHKVRDNAGHFSTGDPARAEATLAEMNQIWGKIANIHFRKANGHDLFVEDPVINQDLGAVVQVYADEHLPIVANADNDVDLNIFFVWEVETDQPPDDDPSLDSADAVHTSGGLIGEDNMSAPFATVYAHEFGHDAGLTDRHFMHPYPGGPPADEWGDWNLLGNLMRCDGGTLVTLRQAKIANQNLIP